MKNAFNFVHSWTYLSVKPMHVTAVGFNLSLRYHLSSRFEIVHVSLVIAQPSSWNSLSQKTNPIKRKDTKLLLRCLRIRNKSDCVHEPVEMAFPDISQCKLSLDSYYPSSLRFLPCGASFPYCSSVVILHIDYALYCSSLLSPKQTCLMLQFSSAPCDLCKPQLQRLLGMK